MKRLIQIGIVVALLSVSACTGTKVLSDADPRIDFTRYSTFGYGVDDVSGEDDVRRIIEGMVGDQLRAKGFSYSRDAPDLKIYVQGAIGQGRH